MRGTCMRCDAMQCSSILLPPEFHLPPPHTHHNPPLSPSTDTFSFFTVPVITVKSLPLKQVSFSHESSRDHFAMVTWNAEINVKLLLMIIQNHFSGAPDYDRLAKEWGSEVSVASLKIQFCKMRREGIRSAGSTHGGRIIKNQGKGGRGRPKKVKSEEGDFEDNIGIEKVEGMECEE